MRTLRSGMWGFRGRRRLAQAAPGIIRENGGTKPVYLPINADPATVSIADNLFWNDIMSEHAQFFAMLLPGDALADLRNRAQQFQVAFREQFNRASIATPDQFVSLNRSTLGLLAPFIEFKSELEEKQSTAEIHSLVWPLFAEHTRHEAERFRDRLAMYSRGEVVYDPEEVVEFWSRIMGEHAEFIAHLLDPQEVVLITAANEAAGLFDELPSQEPSEVMDAANLILDFKTAAEAGIDSGAIKSIIDPALADHVRREAVKFVDEAKRAGFGDSR